MAKSVKGRYVHYGRFRIWVADVPSRIWTALRAVSKDASNMVHVQKLQQAVEHVMMLQD